MKKTVLFLSVLLLGSCQQKADEIPVSQNEQTALPHNRAVKDSLFGAAPWSPIKEQERESFPGLNYFPLNPELRFSGPIRFYNDPQPTQVYATKTGDIRPAVTYGYFPFIYKGDEYRLEILKMYAKNDSAQTFLFLGFTDETTGKETYGAGRYIDLEENPDNNYTVDFNYAYNPYCAYNEKYSCALPPAQNRMPFRITAGEKIFKEH